MPTKYSTFKGTVTKRIDKIIKAVHNHEVTIKLEDIRRRIHKSTDYWDNWKTDTPEGIEQLKSGKHYMFDNFKDDVLQDPD